MVVMKQALTVVGVALVFALSLTCSIVSGQVVDSTLSVTSPPVIPKESDFYDVITIPLPEDVVLEAGGICILDDGRTMVATRRGEVWIVEGTLDGNPEHVRFKRFAQGLQEPLGLLVKDGWIYFTQRGELSRMRDEDGDDHVDVIECVSDAWRISGNYHEYNFGPRNGPDGRLWITTNKPFGGEPFGKVDWRGFALAFDSDGTMHPIACGLRSPAGVNSSPWGDIFYTDNQGEWCGASKLSQIRPGEFHGHPHGISACDLPAWPYEHPGEPPNGRLMPDVAKMMPSFKLPSVWFPYDKMGKSPSGFVWDQTNGKFGPFSGQIFVGDQHHAWVMRVSLEQVGGHWQGACYPFLSNLQCGITRVAWAPDGSLLVGQTNRGWASRGRAAYGLERVVWKGKDPFEIREMTAIEGGFRLTFTRPINVLTALPESLKMSSYTYLLHSTYGSAEVETQDLEINEVRFTGDRLTLEIAVSGLRAGYVHELHLDGLRGASGDPLLHPVAYYTLINIPGGEQLHPVGSPRATLRRAR